MRGLLTFNNYKADLLRRENTIGSGNQLVTFDHNASTIINYISFSPGIRFNLFNDLSLLTSLQLGFAINSKLTQSEQITQPLDAVFPNGSSIRNEFNEIDIPDLSSFRVALDLGFSYDLPLNKTQSFIFSPEAYYSLALSNNVKSVNWSMSSFNLGFSIRYGRGVKEVVELAPIDTVVVKEIVEIKDTIQELKLDLDITAKGLNNNDEELSNVVLLKVEEFLRYRSHPLLPYIFFDKNSKEIPKRYRSITRNETNNFSESTFFADSTLEVYYNLLNIIGKRLRQKPDAKIELMGTNSKSGSENIDLSKARAESVKEYLVLVWQIDEKRISTKAMDLPIKSSNNNRQEGKEENQRVEIISSDPSITTFVEIQDTLRNSTPPSVRFFPKVKPDSLVKAWRVLSNSIWKNFKRVFIIRITSRKIGLENNS